MVPDEFIENTTNEALSDSQKYQIGGLILKTQQEILSLDAEIAKSPSNIEELLEQRGVKSDTIVTLKALSSVIRDIPNEILSKIFVTYTQLPDPDPEWIFSKPPWVLGWVCARWRQVALTTPELWSHIFIDCASKKPVRLAVEILTALFLRAGSSPVSCIFSETSYSAVNITQFISLLAQNSARVRYLSLRMNKSSLKPIFDLPGKCLTTLEELNIYFQLGCYPDPRSASGDVQEVTVFEGTPILQRVSIETSPDNVIWNFNPLWFNLPCIQLTHLRIAMGITLSLNQAHELMRQCTNLVSCSFGIPMEDQTVGDLPTIVLQRLEQLSILNSLNNRNGQFLRSLLLPSLKRLSLFSKWRNTLWRETDVLGLITRSACKIETAQLLLENQDYLILTLLEYMPDIKRLSIRETKIFRSLVRRIVHEDFLPQLTLLKCQINELSTTIENIGAVLAPLNFNEDDMEVLHIIFVPYWVFDIGYCGLTSMRELERSWLKLSLKKDTGMERFLDYADVGDYEAEDLVDGDSQE